ncbi:MAG TPA: 23S rRNA (pseudouridine(1915)-N(3))-methyltransferase RlmH [Flavobacteriales bacterium]|nr:23S rRNA (pseudouridine(1915)-N(3))-methyltransferase RlmH [Flavobacteriales bacterium]HRJ39605.1 23S rRNA (pseudouridine(1915)-N(3))-methyltransferase RlmH [Flavobacteriales bacterium]
MRIKLITMGLTGTGYLSEGLEDYEKRLKRYTSFERTDVPLPRSGKNDPREQEGELLLSKVESGDVVVLLDENGKEFNSVEFSDFIQKRMNAGTKRLVFIIGGAYGFSDSVRKRADHELSLSRMTLTHQMVRLFFTEQLYRAFTIIKGEKYHHQ